MALYTEKRDRGTPGEDEQQQDAIPELSINHQEKKKIITVRVATHWNRGPVRPLGGSSSSQVFKTSLDKALSHLIELALL